MLTIHGIPVSVHTRKVIVAANEKNLPYTLNPVIPFDPPPGWAELSPTGKIPVLQTRDLTLRDSSVICAWLERAHPEHPLYPKASAAWAQALWLEAYAGSMLFAQVVHGLFFQKVIRPNILKEPTEDESVHAILNQTLPKVFGYLEAQIAGGWLAGGAWSLADAAVASNLVNFHYLGYRIDRDFFPKLARHFRAQLARPSMAKALQEEQGAAEAMGLDRGFLE